MSKSEKGYIIGLGLETINNDTYPTISFLLCPDWESDSSYYKIGLGSSYAKVNENFLLTSTLGHLKLKS